MSFFFHLVADSWKPQIIDKLSTEKLYPFNDYGLIHLAGKLSTKRLFHKHKKFLNHEHQILLRKDSFYEKLSTKRFFPHKGFKIFHRKDSNLIFQAFYMHLKTSYAHCWNMPFLLTVSDSHVLHHLRCWREWSKMQLHPQSQL